MTAQINTQLHGLCVELLLEQSRFDDACEKAFKAGVHLQECIQISLLPFVNIALGLPAEDDAIFNIFYDVGVPDFPFFGTERAEEMVSRLWLRVEAQKRGTP